MIETVNGADFSHLIIQDNIHERVNTLINYPLLLKQCHVVNHLFKPIMWLLRLGETNKIRI